MLNPRLLFAYENFILVMESKSKSKVTVVTIPIVAIVTVMIIGALVIIR